MAAWSERLLIERIRVASIGSASGLIRSIGDDCCEVRAKGSFLISTDSLIDSIHFDRSFHPPHLLGRKSIAVNLSDIAAMGGRPRFVLLSLNLPETLEWEWISAWLDGVFEILNEYDCLLIGGDTVKSKELGFTVTVLGEPVGKTAVYRNGAKEGDSVWVSGPLGSAGAGLALLSRRQHSHSPAEKEFEPLIAAHLDPVPRVRLGQKLALSGCVSSMQDISDGLATDMAHICKASAVSACIWAEQLPRLPELALAADKLNLRVEDLILRAGEDYQLLFTVRKGKEADLHSFLQETEYGMVRIGEIYSGSGVVLSKGLEKQEISFQGYEH